jgi:hypothetical protein
MSFLLSEFQDIVEGEVDAQDGEISLLRRERAVKAAVERYSRDRPDTRTEDVAGDGGRYYPLSTSLDYWTEGLSMVTRIQYPASAIASDETPTDLDRKDWHDDYWLEGVRYLYLPSHEPAATETMRITYLLPWTWIASSTTTTALQKVHGFSADDYIVNDGGAWKVVASIRTATHQVSSITDANTFVAKILQVNVPDADFYAVCHLATSICCEALAARYSALGDAFVRTDYSGGLAKAVEYTTRAEKYLEMYNKHLGIINMLMPAGTYANIGTPPHASLQHRWRGKIV